MPFLLVLSRRCRTASAQPHHRALCSWRLRGCSPLSTSSADQRDSLPRRRAAALAGSSAGARARLRAGAAGSGRAGAVQGEDSADSAGWPSRRRTGWPRRSTSEAYAHLFRLLADPGGEFLVPEPRYPLFAPLAALEGVRLAPYPLRYRDGRWDAGPAWPIEAARRPLRPAA